MKPHQRLFRRSLVTVLVAAAAGLASFSFGTATANATEYHYCFGVYLYPLAACEGPRHTLTNNSAIGEWDEEVCVLTTDHDSYTSPIYCGIQNSSQAQCGCRLVYPRVWTGYTGTGVYYGFGTY